MSPSSPPPSIRQLGHHLLAAVLLSVALAGCVRLLEPRSSNITYYLLDSGPVADSVASDTAGLTIGLRQPRLASYLDASRIVTRAGPNTIQFSDFHRWGEDLDRAINRIVALNLEQQAGIRSAEVVPWPEEAAFDYIIRLRVLRFEGVGPPVDPTERDDDDPLPVGHSQMIVRWTVLGPDGSRVLTEGISTHREEGWPVSNYADLAGKLDTSLVVLADEIGSRLRGLSRP